MSAFLETTDGPLCESNIQPEVNELGDQIYGHNNLAESPFALAKWFHKYYQSLGADIISGLTLSKMNGTHRRATKDSHAGIAITASLVA